MKTLMRRKKQNPQSKPLPPSKRLRLEAQRVLKERVQDIADKKGIKLRFCNLKDCESHILTLDSPCANIRMEIGWPPGVPFVHPHDLPNKAKLGFLEAYEPGWTEAHQNTDRLVNTQITLTVTLLLHVSCPYDHAYSRLFYIYLSSQIVVMYLKMRICMFCFQDDEKFKGSCSLT